MLKIDPKYIHQATMASSLEDLFPLLQNAIELEHATIPPYLTANMSIKPGTNKEIWKIIHSIVIEEMLHMSIACNILNALGGSPVLNQPGFIPSYPGPLPMGIGHGLIVGLEALSLPVIKNTFMAIEEPENPLDFPIKNLQMLEAATLDFATIGQFYQAIQIQIRQLAPERLPGDPKKQMTDTTMFPADQLFPILTKQDAINAIDIIIEQGEGTAEKPVDANNELAHYYRFEEIYNGKRLIVDKEEPLGYSYSGPRIPFDSNSIYPLMPNTRSFRLPPGSEARRLSENFSSAYARLVNALHRTFNGDPTYIQTALGMMYDLKLDGDKLVSMPYPGQPGYTVGPTFEYVSPVLQNV